MKLRLVKILLLTLVAFIAFSPTAYADHGDCEPGVAGTCPDGQFCHGGNHICMENPQGPPPIPAPPFDVNKGPTNSTFDAVNPLKLFSDQSSNLSNPGGIMTRVLQFAFPIAGMILFVMTVWGGFEILAGAQEKKSLDSGKQRVTAAIIGFILLFCSYWIAQIIEYIFGISIL